ncbi:hypothetical protein JTE90_016426 [Oedothorax gibbosus]|uniref:Acetoacetyl-CoA synthetase n=1 Tax=Oedothorax gibbosus TaxID=931172 RepID=A0AAV6TXR9_9ARAC|nr:hypothetical protein JTE90_016426 [Oedothorax gibbosus]
MWSQQHSTKAELLRKPNESDGKLLKKFKKVIEDKYHVTLDDYWEFHKWSIQHTAEFWAEIWDFYGIVCSKKYHQILDQNVPMSQFPKWFDGAMLNYAENLLKYRDEHIAMIFTGEDERNQKPEKVTYAQMFTESEKYAAAFRKLGLRKNDVVVCYMSNRKEAIFAMQAVVSIGAIWTGALPLLGTKAVLNRFQQVNPVFLLTVDRFVHQGTEFEMLSKVKEIAEGLPSLVKVIIVPSTEESRSKNVSDIDKSCHLDEFLKEGQLENGFVPPMEFEQLPFSHPVFISYTSGTTGLPKPLIHGCGALLSLSRTLSLQIDTSRDSVFFSVSPVGWLTWNMFATLSFIGCTLVQYEGSPFFLSPTYFWDLVDEFKITHGFLPSSALDEFQKRGYVPIDKHSLSSMRVLISAGSIVKPQNFEFAYEKVKKDVHFAASYGCTEIMGLCLITDVSLPVYKGEIQVPALGSDVRVVDEKGNEIHGEVGELVLAKPEPNLALGLWGDIDGSTYHEKYFGKYEGMFSMGDYGRRNPETGGYVVCCRSDETLKQRGCRFGSSEIYNIVEKFHEVRDCVCVSQYNKSMDERAVLFLKLRKGCIFSQELVMKVREAIENELTVRHVPDIILETQDIPYNMNGKKVEIVVKKIINKMSCNLETIANPESLNNYYNVPELQDFC